MSKLTRNWLIGMVVGWALLIYGYSTHNLWAEGAAIVIFLVFMIERNENWKLARKEA